MSKPLLSPSENSNDMFTLYYIAWCVAVYGIISILSCYHNEEGCFSPPPPHPTTSYEINPVKLDTTLNTVLCNLKVSKVKLSNHRKLKIFALLLASGDVESNPGPVTDPCMVHHAIE